MGEIQVGIEGEDAPAAEALLEIPGISGSYEVELASIYHHFGMLKADIIFAQ